MRAVKVMMPKRCLRQKAEGRVDTDVRVRTKDDKSTGGQELDSV